jgi:hypothetical protein
MERSTGSKVVTTSHNQGTFKQNFTFKSPKWMQATAQRFSTIFTATKVSLGLPHHVASGTVLGCVPTATIPMQPQQTLHLMTCMQRGRYRRTVHQDRIDDIPSDKALFCFLRRQLVQHCGRVRKLLTLKDVRGIYFVKVSCYRCLVSLLIYNPVPPLRTWERGGSRPRTLLYLLGVQDMRMHTTGI